MKILKWSVQLYHMVIPVVTKFSCYQGFKNSFLDTASLEIIEKITGEAQMYTQRYFLKNFLHNTASEKNPQNFRKRVASRHPHPKLEQFFSRHLLNRNSSNFYSQKNIEIHANTIFFKPPPSREKNSRISQTTLTPHFHTNTPSLLEIQHPTKQHPSTNENLYPQITRPKLRLFWCNVNS